MKLESEIQAKIIRRYKRQGYMVVKIGLCNLAGFPDLMLLKDGSVSFIEVKRPGSKPRPLQELRIEQLRKLGFEVLLLTVYDALPCLSPILSKHPSV